MTLKALVKVLAESRDCFYVFSDSVLPVAYFPRKYQALIKLELEARPLVNDVMKEWIQGMPFAAHYMDAPEFFDYFVGLRFQYTERAVSYAAAPILQGKHWPRSCLFQLMCEQWICVGLKQWIADCAVEEKACAQAVQRAVRISPN